MEFKSILIKDTTVEERKQVVKESLGNISASCDGCMARLSEMYDEYIEGKKRSVTLIWNLMGTIYAETWTKEKKEAVQCESMFLYMFTQSLSTEWRCLYEIQKENCIFLSTNVGSADCRMRKQINVDI